MAEIGSQEWIDNVVKAARDNRANQLNPNNSAYYSSRAGNISLDTDSDSSNAGLMFALGAVVATGLTAAAVWAYSRFKKKKSKSSDDTEVIDIEDYEVE